MSEKENKHGDELENKNMHVDSENQNMQGDNPDAQGFFQKLIQPQPSSKKKEPILLLGSLDDEDYRMDYPERGLCIVFNHKNFEHYTGLNERKGTDVDACRLFSTFKTLGFDVQLCHDLKVKEVKQKIKEVGAIDHSKYSCFVCCILTHGEQGILYAKDGKYVAENIFETFRGNNCHSLVGKPKLFFIQACQGDQLDSGVDVVCEEADDSSQSFRIPTYADFVIVYSTVPGFYSWRNTSHGSWFIQALCAVLQKYGREKDLLQLLTIVNRRVALDFVSNVPDDNSMHLKKQVPSIWSTLTKNLKFP